MDKLILALGSGSKDSSGKWLEFHFILPVVIDQDSQLVDSLKKIVPALNCQLDLSEDCHWLDDFWAQLSLQDCCKMWPNIYRQLLSSERSPVLVVFSEDSAIQDLAMAYLKLHLISYRLFKPNQLNLHNLFNSLRNIAWTSKGAIAIEDINNQLYLSRINNSYLQIKSVDKFPPLCDYIVPTGVRIANSANVRLGAYLGKGTTIMHAGFVNFNSGTIGPNMIEGRVSAGVLIGSDSDLGGGSSTMGTLSGGGQILISVGKNCLLGANAGLGIPLGDNCTIESGLYITAGSKIQQIKQGVKVGEPIKAANLANVDNLLFRRNSQSGAIECLYKKNENALNIMLHDNQ